MNKEWEKGIVRVLRCSKIKQALEKQGKLEGFEKIEGAQQNLELWGKQNSRSVRNKAFLQITKVINVDLDLNIERQPARYLVFPKNFDNFKDIYAVAIRANL